MKVTVTLEFDSLADAAMTLERLPARTYNESDVAKHLAGTPRIAYEDRPDVGAVSAPPAAPGIVSSDNPPVTAGNPFAQGVAAAPVVPTAPTVPAPVATPPSAATAPIAAPASAPSPAVVGSVELDKHGLPWDQRIHADAGKGKPKPKIGDGSWRKKRGVDESVIFAVEAELRQAQAARAPVPVAAPAVYLSPAAAVPGGAAAAFMPPGGAAAAVVPTPPAAVPTIPAPPSAVAAPPSTTAASPAAAVAPTDSGFGPLMARLAKLMSDPRFQPTCDAALKAFNLTAIGQLAGRADLVAGFGQYFDGLWAQAAS